VDPVRVNAGIWENLYGQGKGLLQYPSESLVRLSYGLLDPQVHAQVLDYGFGAAANLIHLACRGFRMSGVEVSASAVEIAAKRCAAVGVQADLRWSEGGKLPFPDAQFDAVLAWQVLYYNTWGTLRAAVQEIERVLRPGGRFVGTMAGTGDVSHVHATALGDCEYISTVPGQEDARLLIVDKADLPRCFSDRNISVGEFQYQFGKVRSRHFIVTYERPA
jgi:SAM-dependent methyltransferase